MEDRRMNEQLLRGFNRRTTRLPTRLITIVGALVVFTLLWKFVPHNSLYWLMLIVFGVTVWIASYGWRQALHLLSIQLERLVQM